MSLILDETTRLQGKSRPLSAVRTHPAITAGEIMSSPVTTVASAELSDDAAEKLRSRAFSAAPVVDDAGAVVGLVNEDDLLAARADATVEEVMTTSVVCVSRDTPVGDVRDLLVGQRIRGVLVLAHGRLVGIVTRVDVAALLATEWVCRTCGEAWRGDFPPDRCARCSAGCEGFALQEQLPGS